MRTNMLKYYKYVNEIRQKLDRISSMSSQEDGSWLDQKLGEKLCEKIEKLAGIDISNAYLKYQLFEESQL